MQPTPDFCESVELAAGRVNDATNTLRAVLTGRLPVPHRRRTHAALRHLENAERELYQLRTDPWAEPARPAQLSLDVL